MQKQNLKNLHHMKFYHSEVSLGNISCDCLSLYIFEFICLRKILLFILCFLPFIEPCHIYENTQMESVRFGECSKTEHICVSSTQIRNSITGSPALPFLATIFLPSDDHCPTLHTTE